MVLENPEVAQLLASRLLQRLANPWELAEAETWLEGARIELGDTVAVSSDFHGLDREEFCVTGKDLDLGRRITRLALARAFKHAGNVVLAVTIATSRTQQGDLAADVSQAEFPHWRFEEAAQALALVDMPKATSPGFPSASICRENIIS